MAAWLARLNDTFERDPLIDEYALVPQATQLLFGQQGDEDQGILALEHKLAISTEAALLLYRYARSALSSAPLEASRAALLCCADCDRAWRCRERLLHEGRLDPEVELRFSALLLRNNPKSGEAWAFRRRVLRVAPSSLLERERALVEELACAYAHHYYAWTHWAWLEHLTAAPAEFPRLAKATPAHYGLFHHRIVRLRRQLAPLVAPAGEEEKGNSAAEPCAALLDAFAAERELANSLLSTFPHLESPWAFRLQLFAAFCDFAPAASALSLWRAEAAWATEVEGRLALRFRVGVLAELAGTGAGNGAVDCLQELGELEGEAAAAAPAVLSGIKEDLEGLGTVK